MYRMKERRKKKIGNVFVLGDTGSGEAGSEVGPKGSNKFIESRRGIEELCLFAKS